jgi:hypothetical protein
LISSCITIHRFDPTVTTIQTGDSVAMSFPQDFLSVGMGTLPSYFIYRDVASGEPFDPTSSPKFYPAKDSDELFDALRAKYPHVPNHADRMRDAMIDFLLEERAAGSYQTSPALTIDPSTVSWTSASSETMSSFYNSPDHFAMLTPASFDQSPLPEASVVDRSASVAGPADRSPPSLNEMTGVFSITAGSQPKQRTRRKMTEAEKIDYRNRRIAKACDKCAKRKRKCHHGQNAEVSTTAAVASCRKALKSPRQGGKKSKSATNIQLVPSMLADQTSLFGFEDLEMADLLDMNGLNNFDLEIKPEGFVFDAFVHTSHFANFGDQNLQAVNNSADISLQNLAPHRLRAPGTMVGDFELYSPASNSAGEDGWTTCTNPTTLNFGSLDGGQQFAAQTSSSHHSRQTNQSAPQSAPLQSTTQATNGADNIGPFHAHQSQTAPAELSSARRCPRLGNNFIQTTPPNDDAVVATRTNDQQIIDPPLPHGTQGHGIFAIDQKAHNTGVCATFDVHGLLKSSDIPALRPDHTINRARTVGCSATQEVSAMQAFTVPAVNAYEPSGLEHRAHQAPSLDAAIRAYADLQQHIVPFQSSRTAVNENVEMNTLASQGSGHIHAATSTRVAAVGTHVSRALTASNDSCTQPSFPQLGEIAASHTSVSSSISHLSSFVDSSCSWTQSQQQDSHEPGVNAADCRPSYKRQATSTAGQAIFMFRDDQVISGSGIQSQQQDEKNGSMVSALLPPQSVSLIPCVLISLLILSMLCLDKHFVMLLVFASISYADIFDKLVTSPDNISHNEEKHKMPFTKDCASRPSIWTRPDSIACRVGTVLGDLSRAARAKLSVKRACMT